jgi:hypothetical protein
MVRLPAAAVDISAGGRGSARDNLGEAMPGVERKREREREREKRREEGDLPAVVRAGGEREEREIVRLRAAAVDVRGEEARASLGAK